MTDETMTMQAAQAMLDADRQQRSKMAYEAIRAILEQHKCDLVGTPQITADGRIATTVQVVAR